MRFSTRRTVPPHLAMASQALPAVGPSVSPLAPPWTRAHPSRPGGPRLADPGCPLDSRPATGRPEPESGHGERADRWRPRLAGETAARAAANAILFCPRWPAHLLAQGRGSGPLVWSVFAVNRLDWMARDIGFAHGRRERAPKDWNHSWQACQRTTSPENTKSETLLAMRKLSRAMVPTKEAHLPKSALRSLRFPAPLLFALGAMNA